MGEGYTKAEGYAAILRQMALSEQNFDPDELTDAADFIDEMAGALSDLLSCADSECVSGSSHEPIEAARALVGGARE